MLLSAVVLSACGHPPPPTIVPPVSSAAKAEALRRLLGADCDDLTLDSAADRRGPPEA